MSGDRRGASPRAGRAALAFVLVTLAILVIVPFLVQWRVSRLREEIVVSEPARTLVMRLQLNLVLELLALQLASTDDPSSAGTYAAALSAERDIVEELARLAPRLGPPVEAQLTEARALAERWHERVDDEWRRGGTRASAIAPADQEPRLFAEVIRATAEVDSAILDGTAATRARIEEVERAGLAIGLALGALALGAAGVVAALDARVRGSAAEAQRQREQAERALADAAHAQEAWSRLIRGVTHDVKNPLGAAKGYAQLLSLGIKGPLAPEQSALVDGIQRSVDGALAILADLLDVARADSGGLAVNRRPTDLVSVAREALEDHRGAAEATGHAVKLESTVGALPIVTDPTRVRQVLDNVLSNAIKYTPPPGRITLRVEPASGDGAPRRGRWAAIRVMDTGPGIPPALRERIFDEFTRLDDSAGVKGHGLGLPIARRIARLLGGDLTVVDTPGPGATFILWLPMSEHRTAAGHG